MPGTVSRAKAVRQQPMRQSKLVAAERVAESLSNKRGFPKPGPRCGDKRKSEPYQTNVATKNVAAHRRIRLGDCYQAAVPVGPSAQGPSTAPDRGTCVWRPDSGLVDLEKFCLKAYDACGVNAESLPYKYQETQAMFCLYATNFDEVKALEHAAQAANVKDNCADEFFTIFHDLFTTWRDLSKAY